MPDLITSNWFPVLTLLIGYATKALSDWIDYKRNIARERDAREFSKKEKRFERRNDFQRQTLLELQEVSMTLARSTGEANHLDVIAYRNTGKWQNQLLPSELDEANRLAQARAGMLSARVRDDDIRSLSKYLKKCCSEVAVSLSKKDADQSMLNMSNTLERLHERIGEILRELDESDR